MMKRTREKAPSRCMKPVFLVFCEGETEEVYLDFIRKSFRSPIRIEHIPEAYQYKKERGQTFPERTSSGVPDV